MNDLKRDNPFQEMYLNMMHAKPIAYIPPFAEITGSVTAALFLSQLLYWWGKGTNPQWIYKTIEEIKTEIGLSRDQQQTAIKRLVKLGILEQRNFGIPQKRHFKISHSILAELCKNYLLTNKKPVDKLSENSLLYEENPQTNTDSTTDITSDNTRIDESARADLKTALADSSFLQEQKEEWVNFELDELEEQLGLPLMDLIYAPAQFWALQKEFPNLTASEIASSIRQCALSIGTYDVDVIPCPTEKMFLYHVRRFLKKRIKDKQKGFYS